MLAVPRLDSSQSVRTAKPIHDHQEDSLFPVTAGLRRFVFESRPISRNIRDPLGTGSGA
jgi:hypothetical protein